MVNSSLKQAAETFINAVKERKAAFSDAHNKIKESVESYKENTDEYVNQLSENFIEQIENNSDDQEQFHQDFREEVETLTNNLKDGDGEEYQDSFSETARMIKHKWENFSDYVGNAASDANAEVQDTTEDFGSYEEFSEAFDAILHGGDVA